VMEAQIFVQQKHKRKFLCNLLGIVVDDFTSRRVFHIKPGRAEGAKLVGDRQRPGVETCTWLAGDGEGWLGRGGEGARRREQDGDGNRHGEESEGGCVCSCHVGEIVLSACLLGLMVVEYRLAFEFVRQICGGKELP